MKALKLWHDSLSDALRDVLYAIGPKEVADALWPDLDPTSGARKLHHALDPDRPEKLSVSEIEFLLKLGAKHDCHVGMAHLASVCGYAPPEKINPDDERAKLQREFVKGVASLNQLASQLARMEAKR